MTFRTNIFSVDYFIPDNLKYDFHLSKESAAIGKAAAETLPATDRDGLPRKKEQPAAYLRNTDPIREPYGALLIFRELWTSTFIN